MCPCDSLQVLSSVILSAYNWPVHVHSAIDFHSCTGWVTRCTNKCECKQTVRCTRYWHTYSYLSISRDHKDVCTLLTHIYLPEHFKGSQRCVHVIDTRIATWAFQGVTKRSTRYWHTYTYLSISRGHKEEHKVLTHVYLPEHFKGSQNEISV